MDGSWRRDSSASSPCSELRHLPEAPADYLTGQWGNSSVNWLPNGFFLCHVSLFSYHASWGNLTNRLLHSNPFSGFASGEIYPRPYKWMTRLGQVLILSNSMMSIGCTLAITVYMHIFLFGVIWIMLFLLLEQGTANNSPQAKSGMTTHLRIICGLFWVIIVELSSFHHDLWLAKPKYWPFNPLQKKFGEPYTRL